MQMTYASFMQFYENVDKSIKKHLVTLAEQKGCHGDETENDATATYPKMMPRQHIGSDSSQRYRCKRRRDVSESCKMVG